MTRELLQSIARRRRTLFFGLTLLTAAMATGLMYDILRANGFNGYERAGLALFFVLFTWITGAFYTAIAGFVVRMVGRDRAVLHQREVAGRVLRGRTAVVMPIYNEDTQRVMAGLDVVWSSIKALPQQEAFDLFILSDTRKPAIAEAEEAAWRALVERHNAHARIFYRRRVENTKRKAGNIADFVRSWGGAYDYAVVLDADSIMTGNALLAMAQLMDAHPEAGIIQALPLPTGRETLFARLIQFAARLNSPMLASGLAFWQLGEGNYWGHNAILRLRAFAEFCDLPRLRGSEPLGGEILSHDFVEAAFMRRAGLQVWLLADLGGSWEEVPSNVIDYAARDRRWAQGNLQHLGLLPMRGLHWLSRVHLITGVLSYITSPMWLAVLTLSSVVVCLEAIHGHQYFQPGSFSLFPDWPQSRVGEIFSLLTITFGVLLVPKLLGATLALTNKSLRRGYGGTFRLLASLVIEQVFSMLLAPAMMLFHTAFVLTTLAGKPVTWNAQDRGDRGITFMEALRRHKVHVAIGLLWGAVIVWIAPKYIWWLMPVLAGMVLSVPLTMWTSRASAGRWLRRAGLLLTPEESDPPAELVALNERMSEPLGEITVAAAQTERAAASTTAPATGAISGTVDEPISAMPSQIIVKDVPEGSQSVGEEPSAPVEVPPRVPLRMEAAPPEYLRPRDALSSLQRLLSTASSSSA